jgi:hypothetical protein
MTEEITLLVADRDDELRDELVGQLLADGYQARTSRPAAETRYLPREARRRQLSAARRRG